MEAENSKPSAKVRTVTLRFTDKPEDQALYEALVRAGQQEKYVPRSPSNMAKWTLMMALGFRYPDDAMFDRMKKGHEWRKKRGLRPDWNWRKHEKVLKSRLDQIEKDIMELADGSTPPSPSQPPKRKLHDAKILPFKPRKEQLAHA